MALNEFRQDIVSGEWVLYATNRAQMLRSKPSIGLDSSKDNCPFDVLTGENNELIKGYPDDKKWDVMVVKNKYPVVQSGLCAPENMAGPFKTHFGSGSHEVIVFRDHDKSFYDFSKEDIAQAIRVYKDRYRVLSDDEGCTKYIMIFNNHGAAAGASIYHPHSQIISSPIVPPDVFRSLSGAYNY